jgi:hypothetical protein
MSLLSGFVDKCVSVLRLGTSWFGRLIGSVVEAARTHSYVETVAPSQADTLHKEVKRSEGLFFRRAFETVIRAALKLLRFSVVKVAIDVTEDPYWGKNGSVNTRSRVHELSDESWQYVNLSVVEPFFVPLMSLPYRQVDDLDILVIDLLEYLRSLPLQVSLVLFDRGFYHWELIDYLENRRGGQPWPYLVLVPRNDAIKEYLNATKGQVGVFKHSGIHSKDQSKWRPQTKIVICKGVGKNKNGEPIDWCFATNQKPGVSLVFEYKKRWNIETGFRIHDEATIKSKSSNPLIRYFYHLIGMLLIITWRLHNKYKPYEVFKRYLKNIEQAILQEATKPPPIPTFS